MSLCFLVCGSYSHLNISIFKISLSSYLSFLQVYCSLYRDIHKFLHILSLKKLFFIFLVILQFSLFFPHLIILIWQLLHSPDLWCLCCLVTDSFPRPILFLGHTCLMRQQRRLRSVQTGNKGTGLA